MSKYKALKGVMVFYLSIILIHLYNIEWNFIELSREVFKWTTSIKVKWRSAKYYSSTHCLHLDENVFKGTIYLLQIYCCCELIFIKSFCLEILVVLLIVYHTMPETIFFTSYGFSFFQILGDHVINLLLNLLLPFKLNFL